MTEAQGVLSHVLDISEGSSDERQDLKREWEALAARLQAEIQRWSEADYLAREEAERSRNRAEAERSAAQEVRKDAVMALIDEQAKRMAAEQHLLELQEEKLGLLRQLNEEQHHSGELAEQLRKLGRELEQEREVAAHVDELEVQLRAAQEALVVAAQQATDWEERFAAAQASREELAQEARASIEAERRAARLQEGLRQKAELGIQEATRQLTQAQDELSAALVDRELIGEQLEAATQKVEQLEAKSRALEAKLSEAEQAASASQEQASEELLQRVAELEGSLANASGEVEALRARLETEVEGNALLSKALQEADRAQQEVRDAWRRAETGLHSMSRARAEAEQGKHRLIEALVRERAARIMAQQELERVATGAAQEEAGAAGAAGQALGIDQARLALLHEELTSEHAALNLILEALREMKASMQPPAPPPPVPPAPSTPDK